jgi:chemotaxis protein MotB
MIIAEKGENYIKFRFNDSVLFYPDSPIMKPESHEILSTWRRLAQRGEHDPNIEIGGHTALVDNEEDSFFSWELSADRAIAVLEFLNEKCNLPQSKMTVTGYSHYNPVSRNDYRGKRALNRRVEIR